MYMYVEDSLDLEDVELEIYVLAIGHLANLKYVVFCVKKIDVTNKY